MSKGGGSQQPSSTTQTVKQDPWAPIQPYLKDVASEAQRLYRFPGPAFFPGQTYAGFDPMQEMAHELAYNQIQPMGELANRMGGAVYSGLSNDVFNNPALGSMANTIQRRMGDQFSEQWMPNIRNASINMGQGTTGSGYNKAAAMATGRAAEGIGDSLANLYGGAYNTGLEQQARMAALGPQVMQTALAPSQIASSIGGQRQQMQGQQTTEDIARFGYQEGLPYNKLADYGATIGTGIPGSGTSTSTGAQRLSGGNPLLGAIGGGLSGLSMASSFYPGAAGATGLFASPMALPFALGGALLGGLF